MVAGSSMHGRYGEARSRPSHYTLDASGLTVHGLWLRAAGRAKIVTGAGLSACRADGAEAVVGAACYSGVCGPVPTLSAAGTTATIAGVGLFALADATNYSVCWCSAAEDCAVTESSYYSVR